MVPIISAAPNHTTPTTTATAASSSSPTADRIAAATAFCRSSLPRGTGAASRYFRLAHDASPATVSPKNSATITTSRKFVDTYSVNIAKFGPLEVASSARLRDRPRPSSPSSNASRSSRGSTARNPSASRVRRLRSWRASSTRSGSVRVAR